MQESYYSTVCLKLSLSLSAQEKYYCMFAALSLSLSKKEATSYYSFILQCFIINLINNYIISQITLTVV